jgi:hypothetical protein
LASATLLFSWGWGIRFDVFEARPQVQRRLVARASARGGCSAFRSTFVAAASAAMLRDAVKITYAFWSPYFVPFSGKNYFRSLGYAKNFCRKLERKRQTKNQ